MIPSPDFFQGQDRKPRTTNELMESVYEEVRQIAGRLFQKERTDHTLSPTAAVNEAFLRLAEVSKLGTLDRTAFKKVASNKVRQILIDHARKRSAEKRGGNRRRVDIDTSDLGISDTTDILEIEEALESLEEIHRRHAQVLVLRIFGGMNHREISESIGSSIKVVEEDFKFAVLWLRRFMNSRHGGNIERRKY